MLAVLHLTKDEYTYAKSHGRTRPCVFVRVWVCVSTRAGVKTKAADDVFGRLKMVTEIAQEESEFGHM